MTGVREGGEVARDGIDRPDRNASPARLRRALTPKGTLVIPGGETGWLAGSDRQVRALLVSRFVGQTLTTFICSESRQDLIVLKALIESGQVTPVLDRTYPPSGAPEAMRYLQPGRARGKVALTL